MSETGLSTPGPVDGAPDVVPLATGLEQRESLRPRSRGVVITLATVVALVVGVGMTVLGLGAAETAVANFDSSSWLWSSSRSEVDRVNGVTAKVDTRTRIKDAQNHEIQVSQTDRYLLLRDLDTGQVSALDLTTLQVSAVMPTTAGLGVSVALHGESAFVVDSVQGQIRQLDPRTLAPAGDAITLPSGITSGVFDGKGVLWVGVPTEGTTVAIAPGAAGASPRVLRTVTLTTPGHDLDLSAMDNGVAVLDNTGAALMVVKGDKVEATAVPIDKPAQLPDRVTGGTIPVTIVEDRRVIVVTGGGGKDFTVKDFTVPGFGPLSPAVAFSGRVYCADSAANAVFEFDEAGSLISQIKMAASGGPLELDVRESRLFINAPDGSTARVVDEEHNVREVDKYSDGVLGGDPPPPPPPAPKPKPTITVPGRPQRVVAAAGDSAARISWRKARDNGSAITKYVVEGAGKSITVGANQRTIEVKGLTNGKEYQFTVHAVNAKGAGPKATSNQVIPTRDVPDPPTSVTATARPDGTVTLTWPPANGQGHKIVRYAVTAITGGAQAPAGETRTAGAKLPAGSLTYGTQVAFTIVAINDKGAGSVPSPVSNSVLPFAAPGAPRSLTAATATNRRGAVQVAWQAAVNNGRPIQKYVVTAGGRNIDVTGTSTTLTGLADDTAVRVAVHAVNEAGSGPDSNATARTMGVPVLTWTSHSSDYNSVSATFTPNNKGGAATCRLQVAGAGASQVACTTRPVTLTVAGLWPNRTYSYTVSITSAAGSANAAKARATSTIRFTVICPNNAGGYCNGGVYAYRTPSQLGTAVNPSLSVGATATPQCSVTGDLTIDARPWGAKVSNKWIRFPRGGSNVYFPFAWARLDGGDRLATIPPC